MSVNLERLGCKRVRLGAVFRFGRAACAFALAGIGAAFADEAGLPSAIQAVGETELMTVHAEGAQIYECKADTTNKLVWQFREPIATLFHDGQTVGRHFAGPRWEIDGGGSALGRVEGKADGASPSDIPWLKLSVVSHSGQGVLAQATTIQRIHTLGGALSGNCDVAAAFRGVAYSADYVFLKK